MIDLDLFAGAGGLAVGLHEAGFSPVHLFEKDDIACKTLRQNIHSTHPTLKGDVLERDVKEVQWSELGRRVRLIAAGAPCQPFSLGGKHRASDDERNLFPDLLKAVRELMPSAILVENVRGILREPFRSYFEYVLRQVEFPSLAPRKSESWREHDKRIRQHQCSVGYEPEYHVSWRLLEAADFGVPQNRARTFIVATRYDLPPYRFPDSTHSKAALIRFLESDDYWDGHRIPKPNVSPTSDRVLSEETPKQPWLTVRDAISNLPTPAQSEERAWMNHWHIPGARIYAGHSGSRLDWPAKTIKAGVHGVPGGENILVDRDEVRYFTLRELARIQTFPDSHFFEGARMHITRQVGNAVPCRLASAVGRPLYRLLRAHKDQK